MHGVYIGHAENGGALTNHLGGELADLRVYRRALTDLEIGAVIREGP
jgi:hypothetical protein